MAAVTSQFGSIGTLERRSSLIDASQIYMPVIHNRTNIYLLITYTLHAMHTILIIINYYESFDALTNFINFLVRFMSLCFEMIKNV